MFGDLIWLVLGTLFYGLLIGYLVGLIPAAVLMAHRRSWAYFWAGFVTLGLAWYFGALEILGLRRNAILIVAAAVLAVGFIGARPAVLAGVDGESLEASVGESDCQARGEDWVCLKYDAGISGSNNPTEYLVKVDALGCWEGTALHPNLTTDPKIEGCINLADLR